MEIRNVTHVQNIRYDKEAEALWIIDQTLLPNIEREIRLTTAEEMYEAIRRLQVRGAPAIGICAGYCMYALAREIPGEGEAFYEELKKAGAYLNSSRPTAVNLSWAIGRQLEAAKAHLPEGREAVLDALYQEAAAIHEDDIAKCKAISEYGLTLVRDGDGILTHCNAGQLAAVRYGTALAPLHLGKEQGINFKVYCDETRPLLQGMRLSAFELAADGIDTTVICDNMPSILMKNGMIDAIIVGADRIAANGDTANKIGTSGLAIIARHYGVPFYVAAPKSTFDPNAKSGKDIPIEQRDAAEIGSLWFSENLMPENAKAFNPAFDVTDHELITGFITD